MIIVGAAAGFIATRMFKLELGVLETIALGVIGALVGGFVLKTLLAFMGMLSGFIGAILGVVVLILIYKKFFDN